MALKIDKKEKFPCRRCTTETNHEILFTYAHMQPFEVINKNEDGLVENSAWAIGCENYQFIKCLGCESPSVALQNLAESSDKQRTDNFTFFPPRISRPIPRWTKDLPVDLMELFFEVYGALSNKMPRLALMGARTIFDMVAVSKVGDIGGFKKKLSTLEENGFISQKQKELLDKALDAGSAASHRGFKPDEELLGAIFDIIEHLVGIEELERKAMLIKSKTPKRR